MKVFKFGGASTNSIERIHQLGAIVQKENGKELLIIVSAMGKTTNALEKVATAFFDGHQQQALSYFESIKNEHNQTVKYLLGKFAVPCEQQLKAFYTEVEWLLHDNPVQSFDYYYDQIVCIGELLSSTIISFFLAEIGIHNEWVDVRDILRTDKNFRDATIDWRYTAEKVGSQLVPTLANKVVITQGFIGCTDDNESTTLGREGSDFSAAIFANMLSANSLTIWKDVEGVMNADPKQWPSAVILPHLNYKEVIEMAFYGAQVIHPKTIKPLQNKQIPLAVKCFLNDQIAGTIINNDSCKNLPPIFIKKTNQLLLQLFSKDFSFVGEAPLSAFYHMLGELKIRPNLIQNGAIECWCVLDDVGDKIEQLCQQAATLFDIELQRGLVLYTVRHYDETAVDAFIPKQKSLLQQQSGDTLQVLTTA